MTYDPWPDSTTRVVVVSGPPFSGKTTYVRQHARPHDLIVDVDWIFAALSGQPLYFDSEALLPFVASARDAIYERLRRKSDVDRAWLVTSKPEAASQLVGRFGGEHVRLTVDPSQQQQRRQERKQRNGWRGFLNET